ncbi:MAG: chaperone modulator CbpM [Bacteroidetes bacterium]|nr:chaperone modulator CbpM [Bacteroidota bacterium]MCA6444381.1 chaperone modulator CbpM [Bacteroidota bacterium]
METRDLILIEHFCANHEIEFSFFNSLNEFGLIKIIVQEDNKYLHQEQLKEVEKMMRMHYDLNINMEGIDVIFLLLNRIHNLQDELRITQNKLKLYDNED